MNRSKENISLEDSYLILKEIEKSDISNQRDFAGRLGYSLGKVNFLLKSTFGEGACENVKFC